ncbi:AIR synthase related protein domain protein [[Clostridium] ultunense Esp]|uniref:AIR synthase related protein domain protein n=1 Tax=[Clostridium] ultunense Esp TaxID=1288971 RepID=M1ZCR8_9FIRM|nr:AIR synthase family protein [Schnuerera ultunensis]CCQ95949.1 AIR synthase related protein domain protein [[Clostridium] ultunense Esp]SHD76841.1 AIR synthase related protein domain protein [[Clostridium] ultunense Esp]
MEIGKLPNHMLEKVVFNKIKYKRKEIIQGAAIGEDNAIIDFNGEICIISTDPITGATKDIGRLAIYISCNDVASSGAEPIGALLTILAPPSTTEADIELIMKEAGEAAKELKVEIMGGHTEITDAVNRVVISTTVLGKQKKENMINTENVKVGDKVLITKYAGIEGTSILAKELEEYLEDKIDKEKMIEAQDMGKMISVIKEGIICGEIGVNYMHDITEGGVLGAVWEGAVAVNKGIKIYKELIPMKEVTKEISSILNIDPFRLISSGSMLIIAAEDQVNTIEDRLEKEGIKVTTIGEVVEKGILIDRDGALEDIDPPTSDELYKGLSILD